MENSCPDCGANLALVGRIHRCVSRERPPVSHMANAQSVANRKAKLPSGELTYRYRDANKRRAYQRDLMRRRRATAKASTS